jgi:hypothetical protein
MIALALEGEIDAEFTTDVQEQPRGHRGGSAGRQPYRVSRRAPSLAAAAVRGVAAAWQHGTTESNRHIERRE